MTILKTMENLTKIERLIKALQIFQSYNKDVTTQCEHDTLYICGVEGKKVKHKDIKALDELGFELDEHKCFYSSEHGSC